METKLDQKYVMVYVCRHPMSDGLPPVYALGIAPNGKFIRVGDMVELKSDNGDAFIGEVLMADDYVDASYVNRYEKASRLKARPVLAVFKRDEVEWEVNDNE